MTDKDIIKALECCKKGACCTDCPLKTKPNCMPILFRNVLSLLCQKEATIVSLQTVKEHQQAEIEKLEIELDAMRGAANSYKFHYNESKSEAIKEFVERLKKVWWNNGYESPDVDFDDFIDNLVKEMVGE